MKAKQFNQDALVNDLYDLYTATVKGIIDPKVTSAAVGGAREIGKLLRLKLDQQSAVQKRPSKRKAA